MELPLAAETLPLHKAPDGVIRVAGTRVTLDTVIAAFEQGATAEEIAEAYDVLKLADVYSVLGYYLRNRTELDEYLRRREEEAARIRAIWEARCNPVGLRERLLARRKPQS